MSEFHEGICFYKVSNDGFFMTIKRPMYFVHESKLLLVFYHDGGRNNGGIKEVVAVDVPNELGQYFIGLIDINEPTASKRHFDKSICSYEERYGAFVI